jgi:hypothetical protein
VNSFAGNANPTGAPTAHSALHHLYRAHAAAIEIRDGWLVPLHFASVDAEVHAAQTGVAIAELFGATTLELVGEALPVWPKCPSELPPASCCRTQGGSAGFA